MRADARNTIRTRLLEHYRALIEAIALTLPSESEVVLHDLSLLPLSIIAVCGDVTGRSPGDSATNLLVDAVAARDFSNKYGYDTWLPDGRRLRSSTTFLTDLDEKPIAAICINTDVSAWEVLGDLAAQMLGDDGSTKIRAHSPRAPAQASPEVFFRDINGLANYLITQAIIDIDIPVELMQKRHKMKIVAELQAKNMFMLKSSVDIVAQALKTTRFTIYNYLNELPDAEATDREVAVGDV